MTIRYFYTDPLAAAWMEARHEMQFQSVNREEVAVFSGMRAVNKKHGNIELPPFYIHPDSQHLLEPQIGDLVRLNHSVRPCYPVLDDKGKPVVSASGEVVTTLNFPYAEWMMFNEHFRPNVLSIIQRNGKPFHWPEKEK